MGDIGTYTIIIAASIIIILSYFFNIVSKKTYIPSVIMLLTLGIICHYLLKHFLGYIMDFSQLLELLGIIGLIMIVLEASLDLKLSKEKTPILLKALGVSFVSLVVTSFLLSVLFVYLFQTSILNAVISSIPLSIMSSAIVIPSVVNLPEKEKEFMIYESTFSDILGIMIFFFILQGSESSGFADIATSISLSLILTFTLSIIVSYLLIYVFHKLNSEIRLFLLIAVLILLYALGKMLHLSSLVVILAFGLILNNYTIFFKGKLQKFIHPESLNKVYKQLQLITIESSFIVRTFFFVIFGITISLGALFDLGIIITSIAIIVILYAVRWITLKIFLKDDGKLKLLTAPRGLITILLFFNIPHEFTIPNFQNEILLITIITSSIIMAVGMIKFGKKNSSDSSSNTETKNFPDNASQFTKDILTGNNTDKNSNVNP